MISCRDALTGSAHQVKGHDRRGPRHQETTMPKYLLLENNGEYVDAQALTPARTWVRYGGPDAAPVTTDGPHPETSDLVAGWWLIDVELHEGALRVLVPRVLAGLIRRGEDFDAAEDALQEALLEALRVWPEHPPRDTRAWLTTVATRRLVDARRSEAARPRREGTA